MRRQVIGDHPAISRSMVFKQYKTTDDIHMVPEPWQHSIIDSLINSVNHDGGWGYRPGRSTCAEPTAMVCLALAAHGVDSRWWERGQACLTEVQRPDGGVPVSTQASTPCWATGLAVLAWTVAGTDAGPPWAHHGSHIERAVAWLLATRGRRVPFNPTVYGHDTKLEGWPWVDGTHSWLEPTAYAILALRSAGHGAHPRVREGVKLLLDRALPDGGWNYGNTRILGNTLRPFCSTTGIVLAALAGTPTDARIDASIAYLTGQLRLRLVRSPLTLGWGLIGLTAWEARPTGAQSWLADCAAQSTPRQTRRRQTKGESNALEDALLLLADAKPCPLVLADGVAVADTHE